ncbi:MAG: hypothetical protein AB1547_07955 [Thermodesulfobacteriota bacterium]
MKALILITMVVSLALPLGSASAHVPYIERQDYSASIPFSVQNIEQSIALYAWLQTDGTHPSDDVDVATFVIDEPTRFYAELLVPACPSYVDFVPWFLVTGPGLPDLSVEIPFSLPDGYGAVIAPNVEPGTDREMFYEPFGGKSYYRGPTLDIELSSPGQYAVYYWDPNGMGGDYVGVLGFKEIWKPKDIARAMVVTPLIRNDRELHTSCITE